MIKRLISYVANNAWAMDEKTFSLLMDIFQTKLEGGDISALELYGDKSDKEACAAAGDVAVVPVYGTLLSRSGFFISGTSYKDIEANIQEALDDESVSSIVLDIDSPGGSVAGVYQLGEFIKQASKVKPIYSYTDGTMASAAYWIAAATDKIFASPTADVGSIGVLSVHIDRSKQYEEEGIKKTYIYSGKYKAMGNDTGPLDDEGKKYIQSILDKSYEAFLEHVATERGLSMDGYKDWAEGRVYGGREALDLGMIDGIGTMKDLFGSSDIGVAAKAPSSQEGVMTTKDQEEKMTFDPKKYEGDATFQSFVEGVKAEAKADAETKLASAQKANSELEDRVSKMEAELEKQAILRRESALKAEADAIFSEKFASSNVPESMMGKVRKMLDHKQCVVEGSLDKEAWSEAIATELKDWQSVYESPVQGSSSVQKSAAGAGSDEMKEVHEAADEMRNILGITTQQ